MSDTFDDPSTIDGIINELGITNHDIANDISKALTSVKQYDILNASLDQIQNNVDDVLLKLEERSIITNKQYGDYSIQLQQYKYVAELSDITDGRFIRWFNISNIMVGQNTKLTSGVFVVRVDITPDGGKILCRNSSGRFLTIYMDDMVIFQRFSHDEWIVINVMNQLGVIDE